MKGGIDIIDTVILGFLSLIGKLRNLYDTVQSIGKIFE